MKEFIDKHLIDSHVESYGVSHQTFTIEFRNKESDISLLLLNCIITSNIEVPNNFSNEEKSFFILHKLNLQTITKIGFDKNTLTIFFKEDWIELVCGYEDDYEIWHLSVKYFTGKPSELLIVNADGTYHEWNALP